MLSNGNSNYFSCHEPLLTLNSFWPCWRHIDSFLNRLMGRRGGQVHPLDHWWAWTPSVNFMWVDMKNTHLGYCLRAPASRTVFKVLCFFLFCYYCCLMSWFIWSVSDEISLSFLDHVSWCVCRSDVTLILVCNVCATTHQKALLQQAF